MSTPTITAVQHLPNLLIAGVKKAGTTSLVHYLGQHPDICAGDVKTANHFRGDQPGVPSGTLDEYAAHWSHTDGERYRLESPTTYFYWGRAMAEAVNRTLPDVRVVISLRDPVTRLWSDYHMKRREDPTRLGDVSFEDYVHRGELAHRDGDLEAHPGYSSFARGMYAEVAEPWFDVFGDRFRIVFVEQWSRDPSGFVRELCTWLDLDTRPVEEIEFPVRNAQREFRSRQVARAARGTYRRMTEVAPALRRVKPVLVQAHDRVNGRRADDRMSPAMQAHLREAYASSNRALAAMLRDHGTTRLPGWLREW